MPPEVAFRAQSPEFDRLAVVTIQGGGLYGLNLLGQLSHVAERYRIVPVAVAGNSAGSIVAALYWAGYAPWQIRDIFVKMAHEKKLTALVGPFVPQDQPYTLADFRKLMKDCGDLADANLATESPSSWWIGRRWQNVRSVDRSLRQGLSTIWSLRNIRHRITPHFENRGCFQGDASEFQLQGDDFINKLDSLIREGPLLTGRKVPTGDHLAFGDVRKLVAADSNFNPPALFLTATNVTGRKLEVFNSIEDKYDRVPIAKAVRASAGFPVFFRPVEFRDDRYAGWYADGGIVSNYPAWIFSQSFRTRLLDSADYRQLATRPWAHFGLRLEKSPITNDAKTTDPKVYGSSLFRLMLLGEARTDLEERLEKLVTRSYTIQQPSDKQLPPKDNASRIKVPDDLLDIDAISPELVNEMYRLGRDESLTPGRLSYTLPAKKDIEPLLEELLDRVLLVFGQQNNQNLLFRSNVFIPSEKSLYPRYAVRMAPPAPGTENDRTSNNDHDICLPHDAGLTGACLTTRRPLLCNLGELGKLPPDALDGLFGMPAELHGKVRKDRTWLASVPIFDPLAAYPRELSIPTQQDLPHRTAFSYGLAGRTDGAVLGVLNLDAFLEYDSLIPPLDPSPRRHWSERRIQVALHLMAATAAAIGEQLSRNFARRENENNHAFQS